jgi:hypothetical protein
MIHKLFVLFSLLICCHDLLAEQRRIGLRHDVDWSNYYDLGNNFGSFQPSEHYPDLSVVGALISNDGALGTATLVSPNHIVTAAHVFKNYYDETPNPAEWKFVLGADYSETSTSLIYQIEEISIHPAWIARQKFTQDTYGDPLGDGDILGVDLATAKLNQSVKSIFPARLPSGSDDPIGLRAVLGGFGVLVDGRSGDRDSSNDRRLAGENIIDRSVEKVSRVDVVDSHLGGLLGIDFDSIDGDQNTLSEILFATDPYLVEAREILESGDSEEIPLALEASTADGDSGGPAFVRTRGSWRVHGVVSYGTTDSSYGDVTLYTRLASHYGWLKQQLPDWADSKILDESGWLENPWLGKIFPTGSNWVFHLSLGWIYFPSSKGNSFWGWSDLMKKWIWLSDQAFPFFYCSDIETYYWFFASLESSNGRELWGYDYSALSWKKYGGN